MPDSPATVSLFIPCLVDQVYPEIGLAMVRILRHLDYKVTYDPAQTCCGQPAFNAGHRDEARKVAANFIRVFEPAEIVVAPSGSCTAMVRNYYPELFAGHEMEPEANDLGKKVFEFSEFLVREKVIDRITGSFTGRIGIHNSCHAYRELGIKDLVDKILNKISQAEIVKPAGEPVCCGFGGLFSFKFDTIAAAMAVSRLQTFIDLNVDTLVVNDPGCIMHLRQEALANKNKISILHLTEFLAQAMHLTGSE